ncbi:uncharacterized protein LOC110765996 [Prunus avium]|uniref:Uncharacterized protein LOC110765996 n=1 Tax=Prunus avium TaxID=42229 RepID=A0A6P5TCW1_PRUAV|nr:uncharacterized protein LOC110765996 [Prunus avium]
MVQVPINSKSNSFLLPIELPSSAHDVRASTLGNLSSPIGSPPLNSNNSLPLSDAPIYSPSLPSNSNSISNLNSHSIVNSPPNNDNSILPQHDNIAHNVTNSSGLESVVHLAGNQRGNPSHGRNDTRYNLRPKPPPNPKYTIPHALLTEATSQHEPTCFSEANKHKHWRAAMNDELNALIHNGTWSLVPYNPSMNVVGCKWVFRVKRKVDGTIDRYKARLVAKGFHQQEGVDYTETFSPVVKATTIRRSIIIYVLIYVDDIIITGNNGAAINNVISTISLQFALKDLGKLHYFLGIEVIPQSGGLLLSQRKYILDLLKRSDLADMKPTHTPMASSTKLSKIGGEPLANPQQYRSIAGALQYVTLTRPELAFSVNKVCQFMYNPTTEHWTAVKRILRYLKHTLSHCLFLSKSPSNGIQAFCDADWAGCPDDRQSTGGYVIYLGCNLVSWSAKKQPTVARSSTEA